MAQGVLSGIWLVSDHPRGRWHTEAALPCRVPGLDVVRMGGCGCGFCIVWSEFEKPTSGQVVYYL